MESINPRIAVLGAGGYLGSSIARHCRTYSSRIHLTYHSNPLNLPSIGETSQLDLTNAADVQNFFQRRPPMEVIYIAATYLGQDEQLLRAVNAQAPQTVIDAATAYSPDALIVRTSTTAVYRVGQVRGLSEEQLYTAPTSPRSLSRLIGDQAVLAAKGVVIRPHLVLGGRDGWVAPALHEHRRRLLTDAPLQTIHSAIHINDFGQIAARLSVLGRKPQGVYLMGEREPVTLEQLLSRPRPTAGNSPPGASRARLDDVLRYFAHDRWFDTAKLRATIGADSIR